MLKTVFCLMLLATTAGAASAATPQLENANILGTGGTLTITRMPIKTASGIIYRDITIQLQADENGNVSFARGRAPETAPLVARAPGVVTTPEAGLTEVQPLVQAPSKPIRVQQFRTGTYQASDGSLVSVVGGGNALLEGVPVWTLKPLGSGGGGLSDATWYEGLIGDNPRHRLIKAAGITSLDWAYGTSDSGDGTFGSGALIGATQTGNTLTIVSFHHGCCSNSPEIRGTLTYTFTGR